MSTLMARKWFYGWFIVFVVFVGSFISSWSGGITVSLFFDPIRETQRWTLTQLTGGVTAQGIAILVAAPISLSGNVEPTQKDENQLIGLLFIVGREVKNITWHI